MGASTFFNDGKGADIDEAFERAKVDALLDRGLDPEEFHHYTGTVHEKGGYVVVAEEPMSYKEAGDLADELIEACDPRIDDKWGPAGAIPVDDGRWLFFGWASD